MPRIRCHYIECVFIDNGICSASAVELDPDAGCLTYSQTNKMNAGSWDEDEDELDEDWEDLGYEDEIVDDDDWLDDDEDFSLDEDL